MKADRSSSKRDSAAEVWRLMLETAMSQFGKSASILQQMGLTPGHMKALLLLDPDEPRSMGSLAQSFACDASTMTWLVDRLEERGLVERRMLSTDRRVKTIVLTPSGVKTKSALEARLYRPPDALVALDRETLETLRDALAKLRAVAAQETASVS